MANVTVKEKVVITYNLELSQGELDVLAILCGNILGDTQCSIRKVATEVYCKLRHFVQNDTNYTLYFNTDYPEAKMLYNHHPILKDNNG